MTPYDLMALQLAQASLGCVVAGGGAWGLLMLACRRWPALASSRPAWLLAQLLTVAAFLILLAPQRVQLGVLPVIELAPARQTAAEPSAPQAAAPIDTPPSTDDSTGPWQVRAAQAWLALYLAGVGIATGRLLLAQRALGRLVRDAGSPVDLAGHEGFGEMRPDLAVFETSLAVSPMLIGALCPVLLLPRHLRDFDALQQRMIVAHELTHLRRRDPLWMAASIASQTLLWFNPAMRQLGERLTWAQELSCDRQVLDGRPPPQRKAYAAALVSQLKLQQHAFGPALAFGGFSATSLTARVLLIRQGGARGLGALGRCAVAAGFAGVFAASLVLQPAFAWRIPDVAPLADPVQVKWRAPLEHLRVASFYGVVSASHPAAHHGIDFSAKTGTPVLASADGWVIGSTDLDAGGAKYGKTIEIAHANGLRSFYAHLDRRLVAVGDTVRAGQQIGLSGATGKVTGPHLHFEVRHDGQPVDPESVLAGLNAFGTRGALRARAALAAH